MLNLNVKLISMIISASLCIGGGYTIHKVNENNKPDIEMSTDDTTNNNDDNTNLEQDEENKDSQEDNTVDDNNSLENNTETDSNITDSGNAEDNNSNLSQDNKPNCDTNNNANNNLNSGNNNNTNGNNGTSGNNTVKPNIPSNPQDNSQNNTTNNSENFMAQVEQLIYNKVNEQRSNNGVSNLTYSSTMEKYARIKSKDMGDNNYFDHKDLSGNYITAKMKSDGVSYNAWAENIAYIGGMTDANALADKFMTNWMNSDGHRKNILSTSYSSIGVGVYKIGNKVYATQEFYR